MQETNTALRAILARIEEEKHDVYRNVHANIQKVIMPILYALVLQLPKAQKKYVEMLRTNLEHITSLFISQLSHKYHSPTPKGIHICNMIRNGLQTKEIAQLQGVSMSTINQPPPGTYPKEAQDHE